MPDVKEDFVDTPKVGKIRADTLLGRQLGQNEPLILAIQIEHKVLKLSVSPVDLVLAINDVEFDYGSQVVLTEFVVSTNKN